MKWFSPDDLKQAFKEVIRPLKRHESNTYNVVDEIYENLNALADAVNAIDSSELSYDTDKKYMVLTTDKSLSYDSEAKKLSIQ